MLQTGNVAQAIYQIASQASLYVPLTTVPSSLPSYTSMDGASRWHTSALQALALESVTLPTRLRATQYGRTSFGNIENALSNDGNRRIAALSLSIDDPAVHETANNGAEQQDGAANGHSNGSAQDTETEVLKLDIDMHPEFTVSGGARGAGRSRTHIFSQMQSLRGTWKSSLEIQDINLASRNRFAQGPKVERSVRFGPCLTSLLTIGNSYQSPLLFPALDSFPKIFSFAGRSHDKLAVQASLSASTAVAQRVRQIERLARSMVGIDEREALCDGLIGICEEYEDGWDSDDEDDDDA